MVELIAHGQEAEPLYRKALSVHDSLYMGPSGHPQVAQDLNNLAAVLKNLGHRNFPEAEGLLKRAIHIRKEHLGPGHVDVATTIHNLAQLQHSMGDNREALTMAEEAFAIRIKALGEEHKATMVTRVLVARLKSVIDST
ncbi:hypothetical protein CYMTET_24245 [Cymbomonas tetramitiformis]|uniref:Kinesin light chain n=1 Tax=Cymbomonas tetramitiformis TaxID=36881 RepID=A0AAE0FGD9_9CHLO|nr:hypothetical protein CYMTET_31664 [Cymbomonas tetramitiformis]KAK3267190.1 hypothetical protein CYMTET_24245 [Cymbomonas tetramitiformis]